MINRPPRTVVPDSLAFPSEIREAKTTHEHRLKAINDGHYNESNRYKLDDVKAALQTHYNHKCAFCEWKEQYVQVEHYRPKSVYYWLVYSWDNLLPICTLCNSHKKDSFPIQNARIIYDSEHLNRIHTLALGYNELEAPLLLHPEIDDLSSMWQFDTEGNIDSQNPRGKKTISAYGLYRAVLNYERKAIIDNFKNKLSSLKLEYFNDNSGEFNKRVVELISEFRQESQNNTLVFLAFRQYVLKFLLNGVLAEVLND